MGILNLFRVSIDGNGECTESAKGQRAICSATGMGAARLYRDFPAIAGVTYTCTFNSEMLEGASLDDSSRPFFGVDYPRAGTNVTRGNYSKGVKSYKLSYTVPYDADPTTQSVVFAFGIFSGTSGAISLSNVVFTSSNTLCEYTETFTDVKTSNGTATLTFSRKGNTVTLTGEANFFDSSNDNIFLDKAIPSWALPLQKAVSLSDFQTDVSTLWMTQVQYDSITLFSRKITSNGLTTAPVTHSMSPKYIQLSYACQDIHTGANH